MELTLGFESVASDRLRPILDIWIAAIVKRVGAFESLLGLIGRYVIA